MLRHWARQVFAITLDKLFLGLVLSLFVSLSRPSRIC
jgi:hypothetical protein